MKPQKYDELTSLIKAMSKSEKRQFSLRFSGTRQAKLFNALERERNFSHPQMHHLRSDLRRDLLNVIQSQPASQSITNRLMQQIEEVRLLMERRLWRFASRLLLQVKKESAHFHQIPLQLQIWQLEKSMWEQNVTGINPALLKAEHEKLNSELQSIQQWSTVLLLIESWMQHHGKIISEKERDGVAKHFIKETQPVGFYARWYALRSRLCYAYITEDSLLEIHLELLKALFGENRQMMKVEPQWDKKLKSFLQCAVEKPSTRFKDDPEIIEQYFLYADILIQDGEFDQALDYINPIINEANLYRSDLQIAARELQIKCHRALNNFEILHSLQEKLDRFKAKRFSLTCTNEEQAD